jgi:hypothetical protein
VAADSAIATSDVVEVLAQLVSGVAAVVSAHASADVAVLSWSCRTSSSSGDGALGCCFMPPNGNSQACTRVKTAAA